MVACKKEQLLNNDSSKTVKLEIKGYVVTDTLEFVRGGKVILTGIDFVRNSSLLTVNENDKILVRKKSDKKSVGEISIAPQPFNQVKKIFYDGVKISDNIELTSVSDSLNMGFRLRFATNFKDFYGGPVDIEILVSTTNMETFDYYYTPVKTIRNVTRSFGEFVELQPLVSTDIIYKSYVFKVYKSGTKELPYTSMADVVIDDPENNFGYIDYLPGSTQLLSIAPFIDEGTGKVNGSYTIQDFSAPFK